MSEALSFHIAGFLIAALVIGIVGTRLAWVADRLADRTGLGEAVAGAVLLGGATSLSGMLASITAAWQGHPQMAISNAIGGIAAQTAFLPVADLAYKRANLEHAAASVPNLLNAALLLLLLSGILLGADTPDVAFWGIHPITPLLLGAYLFGLHLIRRAQLMPLWRPVLTAETREDKPQGPGRNEPSVAGLWVRFALYGATIAAAGWAIARTGLGIAAGTGVDESLLGALFTAIATSTPELVTSIAAVRRGALVMAVAGILGGNAFDVMFAVASDVAYRAGSIYHAVGAEERYLVALTMAMTSALLLGLLGREKRGRAGIGFEGVTVLGFYVAGIVVLVLTGP